MPKFKGSDQLFQGFDFQSDFQSSLPNTNVTQGQSLSGIYESAMAPGNFEFLYGKNFVNVGKKTGGLVANNFGIPAKFNPIAKTFKGETFGQFQQIFEMMPIRNQIETAFDRIKAGLDIADAMSDISDAMEGISAIPIIGWVVQVGVQFAKQLTGMFHFFDTAWEKDKEEVPSAAFIYKKETDAFVAQQMFEAILEDDWTRIFWPAVDAHGALGGDFKNQLRVDEVKFITTGGRGWVAKPTGGNKRGGLGVFPGVAKIMDMVQWGGNSTYQEFQDMHPASMQVGQLLWQLVNKNGPEMFRVDTQRLGNPWKQYFDSLEIYPSNVNDLLSDDPIRRTAIFQAQRMMTVASRVLMSDGKTLEKNSDPILSPSCYGSNGWTVYDPLARDCGYQRPATAPDVPDKWRTVHRTTNPKDEKHRIHELMTYRGIANWKIDVLWERQKKALKTITCAYVDESFPAIKGSFILKKIWHESRMKLLHHSAKMAVDVTMIPDAAYRNAMIQSQKVGITTLAAKVKPTKMGHLNLADAPSSTPFMVLAAGDDIGGGRKKRSSNAMPLMIGAAIVLGIMSQKK